MITGIFLLILAFVMSYFFNHGCGGCLGLVLTLTAVVVVARFSVFWFMVVVVVYTLGFVVNHWNHG